jgi:serine/threonine-protein kinase RsbW
MEELTLPGKLESLADLRKLVKEAAQAAGLDETATYNLQLAVDEIATNIITHGYDEAGISGSIVFRRELAGGLLRVILEDTGSPFDPRTLELLNTGALSTPLEDRKVGGLGVHLAFQNVDRFDYERKGDRNVNIFEVKTPGR